MSATALPVQARPSIELLSLSMIEEDPNQPRRVFLEDAIEELALNIESTAGSSNVPWIDGLLHPVTVYENPGWAEGTQGPRYRLLTGARRFRAYKLRLWPVIPTRIVAPPESPFRALLIQLNENLGRQDTSLWEDALAVEQAFELWSFEHAEGTAQQFSEVLSRSPTWISQRRMIARATGAAKQALIERRLSGVDVYRPFVRLPSAIQVQILERVRRTHEPITLALLRPFMPRDANRQPPTQTPAANDNLTPQGSSPDSPRAEAESAEASSSNQPQASSATGIPYFVTWSPETPSKVWPHLLSVSVEQARFLLFVLNTPIPEEASELAAALDQALAKIAV